MEAGRSQRCGQVINVDSNPFFLSFLNHVVMKLYCLRHLSTQFSSAEQFTQMAQKKKPLAAMLPGCPVLSLGNDWDKFKFLGNEFNHRQSFKSAKTEIKDAQLGGYVCRAGIRRHALQTESNPKAKSGQVVPTMSRTGSRSSDTELYLLQILPLLGSFCGAGGRVHLIDPISQSEASRNAVEATGNFLVGSQVRSSMKNESYRDCRGPTSMIYCQHC